MKPINADNEPSSPYNDSTKSFDLDVDRSHKSRQRKESLFVNDLAKSFEAKDEASKLALEKTRPKQAE
jgi:hypothetical protein